MVRRVERAGGVTMAGDPDRLATLEALVDRIDATLWVAAPDLSAWHYMNAACTEAYGLSAEQATADPDLVRGRFHPDDTHVVEEALARARGGEDAELVYRMQLLDGRYRWQLTRIYPLFGDDGQVERILGTGTEVTRLKELEEELRDRTLEAEAAIKAIDGPRRREDELLEVLQSPVVGAGDLPGTYALVTGAAARALDVQRASIWLFDDAHSRLTCALLHDGGTFDDAPTVLERRDYPRYFAAVEADRTLTADDAHTDLRTAEFSEGYLGPLGITSMLDVTVRHRGDVIGVLCCEQVGPKRAWTEQEAAFAWAVADLVSRARTIRDRNRTEEALAQATMSAEQYETIASGIDVMFWIVEPDLSRFHYLNPASERMFGWSLEEIQDDVSIVWDRVHPDDRETIAAAFERGRVGVPITVEYRMRDADDRYRWLLTTAFPDFDAGGRLMHFLGTGTDITARKELEDLLRLREVELEASNRRFETIAATIDTMFWVASPDLSVMHYINGAVEQGFGYAAGEIYANPGLVVGSFHAEDRGAVLEQLAKVAAGEPAEVEFRVQTKDGAWRWLWAKAYPDLDEDGQLDRIIGTAVDITERRALEEALRLSQEEAQSANRAKSAFLATMTHEIRTPMIGVTGMLEVLAHSPLDAEQQRALAVVRTSSDALLQVLGDVLDFSKIEAGRLDLQPTTVSLGDLVSLVVRNFDHPASSKGLLLTHDIDPAVAPAHEADPVRLRQILTNFVSNALKFTPSGSVHVALRVVADGAEDQLLELAVTDTGIGISAANQQKLFERFTQAESSTTRRFGGTGLGLSICKRLAELMDGEITMTSREGAGTTMRLQVRLPIADPADLAPPEDAGDGPALGRRLPTREQAEAEGSVLLLVEDHPINRLVLTQQLGLAGFEVDVAEDGRQGYERWESGRYALVFSDLHMPEMDGQDLVRAIRAAEAAAGRPRTPVVALTAATLRDELDACLEAGMDDVMVKPTSVPALARTLRRWLPALDWTPPDPDGTAPVDGTGSRDLADHILATLTQLSGGDDAVLAELRQEFVRSTRADLDGLEVARRARDDATVARLAHRLKGSSRMVAADALAELAERIERSAGDPTAVAEAAAALAAAARPVLVSLDGA